MGSIKEGPVQANAGNGGTLNFTTYLTPGTPYQICEVVLPGWTSSISLMPNSFTIQTEPDGDNSTICFEFTPNTGDLGYPEYEFDVNNDPPPGGTAHTIGYWKNWSSCTRGNQRFVLDWTLWSFSNDPNALPFDAMTATRIPPPFNYDTPGGSAVFDAYDPGAVLGAFHVRTCQAAFNLLSKQPVTASEKKNRGSASDPVFQMAAQFLAVKLNIRVGADARCLDDDPDGPGGPLLSLIAEADKILTDYHFNGSTYDPMPNPVKTRLNQLATIFDNYNNNGPTCP